jgi:CRP-like cAMP-binding protein
VTNSQRAANNRLLDLLPSKTRQGLLAAGRPVELEFGDVLREPGQRIRHVYFPTGSSISLLSPSDAGATLEVAVIGNEGVLGVSVAFGINVSSQRALVNARGTAWQIAAGPFCRQFERSPALQRLLNRYIYVVMAQMSQTAMCASFHDVAARLARWLLIAGDRSHSETFRVTQASISAILGVRREGVNRAASLLQQRKLIRYVRGRLTIVNRRALQAAACSCYSAARDAHLLQYPGVSGRTPRRNA